MSFKEYDWYLRLPTVPGETDYQREYNRREALYAQAGQTAAFPDATNTGNITPLDKLQVYTGNITNWSGTTIKGMLINGYVNGNGANQKITDCIVTGGGIAPSGERGLIHANYSGTSNLIVEDVLCQPTTPDYRWNGFTGHHATLKRVHVKNTTDGVGVFNTTSPGTDLFFSMTMCWVDLLVKFYPDGGIHLNGTHNDAVQIQGGLNGLIKGCRLDPTYAPGLGDSSSKDRDNTGAFLVPDKTTGNACIQLNQSVGQMSDWTVIDNWLGGGAVTINGIGITSAVNLGNWLRNKFDRTMYYADVVPDPTHRGQATVHPTPTINFPVSGDNANTFINNGAPVSLVRVTS